MNKQRIIEGFQSRWLPKAASYIGNALKLGQLLSLASDKLQIKALSDVKDKTLLLMAYVRDVATGRYKDYSATKLSLAVAGIVYLVSPLDFVPDALLLVGWSDDIPVLSFVFSQLADELIRYQAAQPQFNPEEISLVEELEQAPTELPTGSKL